MNNLPLVSILMTSYNRQDYIQEAIESVLASTYKNFELIIVDDRSSDKTVEIAKRFAQMDNRVSVYVNPVNLKDYPNRNKAASYAKGKYIKYLDSDDAIFPDGIEYCVSQMEKYPEAALGMFEVNGNRQEPSRVYNSEEIIRRHFFEGENLSVGPSGTILRRDVFERLNGFKTDYGVASDYYFNLMMACEAPVVLLNKDFFFYRMHPGQEQNNKAGYLVNGFLAEKDVLTKLPLPLKKAELSALKKRLYKRQAKKILRTMIKERKPGQAFQVMRKAGFTWMDIFKSIFSYK